MSELPQPQYSIRRAQQPPEFRGLWDGPAWGRVGELDVAHFLPHSSAHRPRTPAKLLHSGAGLHVLFRVFDRYVRCAHAGHQIPAWRESCVEAFLHPRPDKGYFNFEMTCGGSLLLFYVSDWTPQPDQGKQLTKFEPLPNELLDTIRVYHSMPRTLPDEIQEPVEWRVEYLVPWKLFETYPGSLGPIVGQTWRANFYKCADDSSHPTWASWSPLPSRGFHQPAHFGHLVFEDRAT